MFCTFLASVLLEAKAETFNLFLTIRNGVSRWQEGIFENTSAIL